MRIYKILIIKLLLVQFAFASDFLDPTLLDKVKNSVVSIDTRIALSVYRNSTNFSGTGFIIDKENGFILTNHHITGSPAICSYFITFYNGQQAEAKLLYYDLWQDYAILKVLPENLPSNAEEIKFSKDPVKENQQVLVVGNNEGKGFSAHIGYISSLYDINGEMPQASYIVNLNAVGGSSGSPLLNEKNEAIGIVYGGGQTYCLALKAGYIEDTLASLRKGEIPTRKHIGLITELYSLDKAVKHRNFPKNIMEEYLKNFPDSKNKVLAITNIIAGSKAQNLLIPGDIIWEADGQIIAADLLKFDLTMNGAKGNKIELTIYRNGEKLKKTLPLYNINKNKIEYFVDFAGAVFFEADDFISAKTGMDLNSVVAMNVQNGSSFSHQIYVNFNQGDKNFYRMAIKSLDEKEVSSVRDLAKIVANLKDKKFINVKFKNYQPYFPQFQINDLKFISSQDLMIADIVLDSMAMNPRFFRYDAKLMDWVLEK